MTFQCVHECGDETGDGKSGREVLRGGERRRLPGVLYWDDLALCAESEEDLRVLKGSFVEVCKRRGLKVTVDKSKVTALGGEERSICEVVVDGRQFENI